MVRAEDSNVHFYCSGAGSAVCLFSTLPYLFRDSEPRRGNCFSSRLSLLSPHPLLSPYASPSYPRTSYPFPLAQVYSYLCRVMYNRRNKMNPLWNSLVIGGVEPSTGVPFLGMVSMQGTHYVDSHVTTGVDGFGRRFTCVSGVRYGRNGAQPESNMLICLTSIEFSVGDQSSLLLL